MVIFTYKAIFACIGRCFLLCSMISMQVYAGNEKLTDGEVSFLVEVAIEAGKRIQTNWFENRVPDQKERGKYRYKEPDKENEQLKPDGSLVTSADKESDNYIEKSLAEHETLSSLPRISEESKYLSLDKRKEYERHILIDPLDGTSKFEKGEVDKVSIFIVVLDKADDDRGGAKPVFSILHRPFERSSGDVGEGLMVEDGVTLYGGEDYGVKLRRSCEPEFTLDAVPTIHEVIQQGQPCAVTVTDSTWNPRLVNSLQRLGCRVKDQEELSGSPFMEMGFSIAPRPVKHPSVSKFFAMIGMAERGQRRIVRQATENIHAHICLGISKDKESDQTQNSWAPEEVDIAVMHALGIPLGIHFYDINGDELRYNKREHLKMGHHIGLPVEPDKFRELFPKELWSEEVLEGKDLENNGNDSE